MVSPGWNTEMASPRVEPAEQQSWPRLPGGHLRVREPVGSRPAQLQRQHGADDGNPRELARQSDDDEHDEHRHHDRREDALADVEHPADDQREDGAVDERLKPQVRRRVGAGTGRMGGDVPAGRAGSVGIALGHHT